MRGVLWPCLLGAALGCDGFRSGDGSGGGGAGGGGGSGAVDPLACSAPMFVDDFEDGVIASTWTKFGTKVAEAGGALGIEPDMPGVRTGVRTDVLDWSNQVITLELAQIEKTDQTGIFFQVAAVDETVSFGLSFGGNLVATSHQTSGEDPLTETPFDAKVQRYWRIIARKDQGIEWQVSADALEWTVLLNAGWLDVMAGAPMTIYAEDGEMDAAARYERISVCPL